MLQHFNVNAYKFLIWCVRNAILGLPIHWTLLNGRVEALRILLDMGCDPSPSRIKVNKRSSAAVELPIEMCDRLYGAASDGSKGAEIRHLLTEAISRKHDTSKQG